MTTRAVHIEIVPTMDTSSCVMGIERFAARRGHPHTIWSDNGTNFVGADKELALCFASLDPGKVAQTSASKGIKWKFNPPSATHHEGVSERLVQSCKRLFYKILGNRRLTDEVLRTTFCLVDQFLNSKQLSAASSDPKVQRISMRLPQITFSLVVRTLHHCFMCQKKLNLTITGNGIESQSHTPMQFGIGC